MSPPSSKVTVLATPVLSEDEGPRLIVPKDFGFLPVPRRLRYDPDKPFHFGTFMNMSFGFASTFSKSFPTNSRNHLQLIGDT